MTIAWVTGWLNGWVDGWWVVELVELVARWFDSRVNGEWVDGRRGGRVDCEI